MIRVGDTWERGRKTGVALLVKFGGAWMTIATAIAYLRMLAAAHEDGVTLQLNSGWRSYSHQAQLYSDFVTGRRKAVVAKPGHSNHQSGIALDIETGNGSNEAFAWLNRRAAEFGFKRTVPSEPWHWELRA